MGTRYIRVLAGELGSKEWPSEKVDVLIEEKLTCGNEDWLLIGRPPCQAYSNAGRSRVVGIDPDVHRVCLYKEYLRIITKHRPSVFVMASNLTTQHNTTQHNTIQNIY